MKMYISMFRIRFNTLLQYRAAAIAGACTQFFFGFIMVMVYEAFFSSSSSVQPMTFEQTITYIWLGQMLFSMFPLDGDREILEMIRSGNVVYELLRPADINLLWLARKLANRAAPTLLRVIPLTAALLLLRKTGYGLMAPADFLTGITFVLSLIGALLLASSISNMITISALWTIAGEGVRRLFPSLFMILSGLIVPLPFFPDWAQGILRFLPFPLIMDIPFKIYIGLLNSYEVFKLLIMQLIWILVFHFLCAFLVKIASRRIIIQGG